MKKFLAAAAALFAFTGIAKADITDGQFSTNQIFDVQYYWSGNTLNASSFIAPYDMNFSHPTVGAGQYFKFFQSTTNPGTYGLGLYNANGTLAQVVHNTGTLQAIGPDALFYVGSGFFGTVITTSAGYSYGQSGTFTNMDTSVSGTDASSYTWASTTPLSAGQTASSTPATPPAPTVVSTAAGPSTSTSTSVPGVTTTAVVDTRGSSTTNVTNAHTAVPDAKNINVTRTTTTVVSTPITRVTTQTTPITTTTVTTPTTVTTWSDGSTTTSNGTPVTNVSTTNQVVAVTTYPVDVQTSTGTQNRSVSATGTKDAIAHRNMNLFLIDPLATKDGAWASPYGSLGGKFATGGAALGYQKTIDGNTFGFALNHVQGDSRGYTRSTTSTDSTGGNAYILTRQEYLWLKASVGFSQSNHSTNVSIPEFALTNASKVRQNNYYADLGGYSAGTLFGIRAVSGVIINYSDLKGTESGSPLLSSLPANGGTTKVSPYVGARYEYGKAAVETRIYTNTEYKTVVSTRASVNQPIAKNVYVNATIGFDKGVSQKYNNVYGLVGLKWTF